MSNKLQRQLATIHLERGDALVVDRAAFSPSMFEGQWPGAPRDVRIFAVSLEKGQSAAEAFAVLHANELEALTKAKLYQMVKEFLGESGHIGAVIDGIEKDFCACSKVSEGALPGVSVECSIHERCAVLRATMKEKGNE